MSSRQLTLNIKLRDDATFSNYVGEAAARLHSAGSPVLIWGAPGSGRSHLLEAACHEAHNEGCSAIYLAKLDEHGPEILRDLETVELVCLDDVDRIVGDADMELALFHLINGSRDHDHRLILASDCAASQLSVELNDLRSRLLGAVSIQTDQLSDDEKLAALRIRAHNRGFELNEEVGHYILGRAGRSMSNLVSLLHRLETESLTHQRKLTIPFVKSVLRI